MTLVPSFALLATLVGLFSAYFTRPPLEIFAFSKWCRYRNQAPFSSFTTASPTVQLHTRMCVQTHKFQGITESQNTRLDGISGIIWSNFSQTQSRQGSPAHCPASKKCPTLGKPLPPPWGDYSNGLFSLWKNSFVHSWKEQCFLFTCCLFHTTSCKKGASIFFVATL